ncbi:hypothetical protein T484DRAFT_1626545, partial [Baffinella frigidus]
TLNPQPPTLNPQPSTLNPQPSTLYPQPSTLNPEPRTQNPQHAPWAGRVSARGTHAVRPARTASPEQSIEWGGHQQNVECRTRPAGRAKIRPARSRRAGEVCLPPPPAPGTAHRAPRTLACTHARGRLRQTGWPAPRGIASSHAVTSGAPTSHRTLVVVRLYDLRWKYRKRRGADGAASSRLWSGEQLSW